MQHRRRRAAVGLAVTAVVAVTGWLVVVVAGADTTTDTTAASAPPAIVEVTVDDDGVATSAPGVEVDHEGIGVYRLTFPRETHVAMRSWDVPAEVTVRPLSSTSWMVAFVAGGEPIDTPFTLLASPLP